MSPQITVADDVADAGADWLVAAIERSIARTGRCRLGLSGGSTPGPILAQLKARLTAAQHAALLVTWVDERHPEASNRALAAEAWLNDATVGGVLPMVAGGSLDEDCAAFARAFASDFGGGLDVALLGAGPDGHIASLFPGHRGLQAGGLAFALDDSPKPPSTRISLTMAVLNACPAVVVVARGEGKADALAAAARGELPLGRLAPSGDYAWILDADAASKLEAA